MYTRTMSEPPTMLPAGTRATVGWISPLPLELDPAVELLEGHQKGYMGNGDPTCYSVGQMGAHVVAMAVLSEMGTNPATSVSAYMCKSFPDIKHLLVVGIAGGIPCYGMDNEQIALGDVVVSTPRRDLGGVVAYEPGAFVDGELSRGGHLHHPTSEMLGAVANLRHDHRRAPPCGDIPDTLRQLQRARGMWNDPGGARDIMFAHDYKHEREESLCEGQCDLSKSLARTQRGHEMKAWRAVNTPAVHYGIIASGNALIKSTETREEFYEKYEAIAFEMEAMGVLRMCPALVVRGICDYADSHKNKTWQDYAAATAAAYAKQLVLRLPPPWGLPPLTGEQPTADHGAPFLYLSSESETEADKFIKPLPCQRRPCSTA